MLAVTLNIAQPPLALKVGDRIVGRSCKGYKLRSGRESRFLTVYGSSTRSRTMAYVVAWTARGSIPDQWSSCPGSTVGRSTRRQINRRGYA